MDGVKRCNFFCSTDVPQEGRNADFVLASDFDASRASAAELEALVLRFIEQRDQMQATEAALREELVEYQKYWHLTKITT